MYRVEIAPSAAHDLGGVFDYIAADSHERALNWLSGLYEWAERLSNHPHRCGLAPESRRAGFEIRQLRYGSYRLLFTMVDDVVTVIRVRHAARKFLRSDEL